MTGRAWQGSFSRLPPLTSNPHGGTSWRYAGLVQFMHRIAGYLLLALGIAFWLRARRSGNRATRGAFAAVLAMLVLQLLLGIVTVLLRCSA